MIPLTLNGEALTSAAPDLAALLVERGFTARVATAVNGTFVPEARRPATPLRPGDRIEVLGAMQGG